jgi:GNAT superfamily N-acetyltransferase
MKLLDILKESLDLNDFNIIRQGNFGDDVIEYIISDEKGKVIFELTLGLYDTNNVRILKKYPYFKSIMRIRAEVNGFYSIITAFLIQKEYQKQGLGSQLYNKVANELWDKKYMLVSTGDFLVNRKSGEKPGQNLWASLVRKGKAKTLHPKSPIGFEADQRYVYIVDDSSFTNAYKIFTDIDLLETK